MALLSRDDITAEIGVAEDQTIFTGTAPSALPGGAGETPMIAIPVNPGGMTAVVGNPTKKTIPTEHGQRGDRYGFLTRRNDNESTVDVAMWPEIAGMFLNGPITLNADNLPKTHHMRQFYNILLGVAVSGNSAPDIGRETLGMIQTGWSLTWDLDAGEELLISPTYLLNQDRTLAAKAESSSDATLTAGSDVLITFGSVHGFRVGERVSVADGSTTADDTEITVIDSTTTLTIKTLSDSLVTVITVTRVAGTLTFPPKQPYTQTDAKVDVAFFDPGGAPTFTGHNTDISAVSCSLTQPIRARNFNADLTDAPNHKTWRKATKGTPTATYTITFLLNEDKYSNLYRNFELETFGIRIMSAHAEGDTTTTDTALTVGQTSISVLDESVFAAGEIVMVDDGTFQTVATILSTSVGTLTLEPTTPAVPASIASGATVTNAAFEIRSNRVDIETAPLQLDEDTYQVEVTASVQLNAGEAHVVTVQAYNHAITG